MTDNNEKITNEELAQMISKGFDGVQEQFKFLRAEFKSDLSGLRSEFKSDLSGLRTEIKADIYEVDKRISSVEDRVKNIEKNMVTRLEFEDISSRTKLIENKLSIESGK